MGQKKKSSRIEVGTGSEGRPPTRWTGNLVKVAKSRWMQAVNLQIIAGGSAKRQEEGNKLT